MRASGRFRLAADSERPSSGHPTAVTRLIALARRETVRDIALTAMLILECAALFIAAPLAALDYDAAAFMIDLLVLGYALLLIVISRGRAAGWLAAASLRIFPFATQASALTARFHAVTSAGTDGAASISARTIKCCIPLALCTMAPCYAIAPPNLIVMSVRLR